MSIWQHNPNQQVTVDAGWTSSEGWDYLIDSAITPSHIQLSFKSRVIITKAAKFSETCWDLWWLKLGNVEPISRSLCARYCARVFMNIAVRLRRFLFLSSTAQDGLSCPSQNLLKKENVAVSFLFPKLELYLHLYSDLKWGQLSPTEVHWFMSTWLLIQQISKSAWR